MFGLGLDMTTTCAGCKREVDEVEQGEASRVLSSADGGAMLLERAKACPQCGSRKVKVTIGFTLE